MYHFFINGLIGLCLHAKNNIVFRDVTQAEEMVSLFSAQLTFVNTQKDIYVGLINTYKAMGGGWVVLAEQRANQTDFRANEDGYLPDPAAAASYSEAEPVDQ